MGRSIVLAVFIMIFQASISFAEEECLVLSAQDILRCALNQHPDVLNSQAEKFRDEKLVDIAKQRPNPELQSRILEGQSADDTHLNTETSLLHTLELGGKRKSRILQAKVLAEKSGIEVKRNKEEVALQTVLALYRLRQMRSELGRVEETILTFGKILSALKSRPKLTPEQEVSQASFSLAREDYKLKKIALTQEQAGLIAWLEVATVVSSQTILRHLPSPKTKWPDFPAAMETEKLSNSTLELAHSEKNIADKNLGLAKSKAWPDLKIGPSFDTEALDNGGTRWLGGVNFSIPLPILNLNRGEKAFAKADQFRAQTNLELTIRKTESERILQLKRYQASLKALRSSRSISGLAVEHQNIEAYFEKGLVPSTLVIEIHNQLYDITRTRNEQELIGVDALWRLYIIDGKFLDSKI
ncbi:MAG: TolC family protein [Deltaproteobacteria bacterium]|nr:TolC family protein [Deltaproteobacteria bacterium]